MKNYKNIFFIKLPYCVHPDALEKHEDYRTKSPFRPIPSLALASLCGFLEKYQTFGYEFKAVDINIEAYKLPDNPIDINIYKTLLTDVIKNNNYDVLCISVMFVFNIRWLDFVVKLAREHRPGIKIIVGGGYPTLFPERVLKENDVDDIVIGEGEATLIHILNRYNNYNDEFFEKKFPFEGYGTRNKDNTITIASQIKNFLDLDCLPSPAWKYLDLGNYFDKSGIKYLPIEGSRGCPYQCTFCCTYISWGKRVRYKSVDGLISEMKHVAEQYPKCESVQFIDDNLTFSKKWIKEFLLTLIERKLPISMNSSNFSVKHLDEEVIDLMARAGMKNFGIAVETGSEEVQKSIKKRLNFDKIRDVVKIFKKKNLYVHINWMLGFPNETIEQIESTFSFARELKANSNQFLTVLPYPGTELFEEAKRSGLLMFEGNELDKFDNRQCDYLKADDWNYVQLQKMIYDINIELNFLNNPAIDSIKEQKHFLTFLETVILRLPDHVIGHIVYAYLHKGDKNGYYDKHYKQASDFLKQKTHQETFGKYLNWDNPIIRDFNAYMYNNCN